MRGLVRIFEQFERMLPHRTHERANIAMETAAARVSCTACFLGAVDGPCATLQAFKALEVAGQLFVDGSDTRDLFQDMDAGGETVFGTDCGSHLIGPGGVRAGVNEVAETVG